MVIGLGLCPFAERVFKAETIRYVVSESTTTTALLIELSLELTTLAQTPRTSLETAFLIHPHVLSDFREYNDFLGMAETLVKEQGLKGKIQVVGFHPKYQFQNTTSESVENYTNRSPYPMIHLLREQSISEVAAKPDELLEIPRRNIKTLNQMGLAKILERLKNEV